MDYTDCMAFYVADFLCQEYKIGELCFWFNPKTNMFELAMDNSISYPPEIIESDPGFLLFLTDGEGESSRITMINKSIFEIEGAKG